jgi:hypothetical protein
MFFTTEGTEGTKNRGVRRNARVATKERWVASRTAGFAVEMRAHPKNGPGGKSTT